MIGYAIKVRNRDNSVHPIGLPGPSSLPSSDRMISRDAFIIRTNEVWHHYAQLSGASPDDINAGGRILEIELQRHLPLKAYVPNDYDASLQRLLLSQMPLRSKTDVEGRVRFVAIWILHLQDRMPDDIPSASNQFAEVRDIFLNTLRINLNNCLSNRMGYEDEIQANVAMAKSLCDNVFATLQKDSLFPSFKRPWTDGEHENLLKYIESRRKGWIFNPYAGNGDQKLYYSKYLEKQARAEVRLFIETASLEQVLPIIDKNRWWGQCLWSTQTQSGDVFNPPMLWPYVGSVSPAPSVFNK